MKENKSTILNLNLQFKKGLILLVFLGISAWFFIDGNKKSKLSFSNSWVFKENKTGPIIGDLGGIPVSVPKSYAHFVEYENDPHFLKPRKGEPPKRTYQSKLRSFGFEFRFPDMAAFTLKMLSERRESTLYNTMWMSAGVDVASYHNQLSLQRMVNGSLSSKWGRDRRGYKQLPDKLYGLVVNIPDHLDKNKQPNRNMYFHLNDQGQVDSYIRCDITWHDAAPCGHLFLVRNFKNTIIRVSYRASLLSQWQEIQSAVTKLILGFSVKQK